MSAEPPAGADGQGGPRLVRLTLTDFRNYPGLTWEVPSRLAVVTGPNGSGKTNLLEAVSLLVPGRGLRGARGGELPRHGVAHWAVAGRFLQRTPAAGEERFDIGTGTVPDGAPGRRVFRLDGQAPGRRGMIAERLSAVWLTPQMDRLFGEGPSGRRRFLDRLVLALEPGHAGEVAAHDEAMSQRNRLLADGRADRHWLSGLEASMARHAVAAAAARRALVQQMNGRAQGPATAFPRAGLVLNCPVAARLDASPALAVEDWLRAALEAARVDDARQASTGLGIHRADLAIADADSGLDAAQASTGQQKALLVGIVLAHAALIAEARGFAPLMLLDEPLVHLDAERRRALLEAVAGLPAQVLLTGTDADLFAALRDRAAFFATARSDTGGTLLCAGPQPA